MNDLLNNHSIPQDMRHTQTRVLIVEDEFVTACDIQASLEEFGYKVVGTAANAQEALALAAEHDPHIAIIDIVIQGDRDGVSLAAALRQDYALALIFLTSQSDEITLSRAVTTKPNGYVLKPFDANDLNVAIRSALASFEQSKSRVDDRELVRLSQPVMGGLSPANLNKVHNFIDRKLNTDIPVQTLADLCGLSEKHFAVQFKKSTSYSPHQFITNRRMDEAKRLLSETKLPISEVAKSVGYANATHFSTVFKKQTGFKPSAYRAK